ncbi:uncharacterized protein LOC133674756 [Populus nigra]|uniref:uncharacterized protein LOC133674756 n=1 Tax=Populus nigra TaxID=3691 RepID=UPI002B2782AC|nr:uncharacterized protein LOC133674756 [Populus nigra]
MSWLFNSLQSNDPDSPPPHPPSPSVQDDLLVIGDSIGRQLRGVANFLAPPPPPPPSNTQAAKPQPFDSSSQSSQALLGIRNDLAEIGDSLKSGLSKLTSNFLQFKDINSKNSDGVEVAGINEEVIGFVKEISLRPECWIDFPLPLQNDFRMTDAQREHVLNVEHFVPSLAQLRNNLQSEMGNGRFWMVYFILLIPRLNEHDFEVLSTPQIVETRNLLLQKLQNKRNVKVESSKNSKSGTQGEITTSQEEITEIADATEGLKINEENSRQFSKEKIDNSTSIDNQKKLEDEQDVSFSDLEDDDSDFSIRLSASRKARSIRAPSPSGSSDWIQLNEGSDTQGGPPKARQSFSRDKDSDAESSDWHKVDEYD